MSGYKNPQVFSKDKPYDRYKEEIRAWYIVTELDVKKQGVAIALFLPSGSRDKVFNELKLDTINADDVDKLTSYLDCSITNNLVKSMSDICLIGSNKHNSRRWRILFWTLKGNITESCKKT